MIKELSPQLLEILSCPLCKGDLVYDKKAQELLCEKSKLAFKVADGIPNMLVDEARKLEE